MEQEEPMEVGGGAHCISYQDSELSSFKNLHDEAYLYVDMGLCCDSQNQTEQAVVLYTKGLHCLKDAIAISIANSHQSGTQWQKVKALSEKMTATRGRIETRKDFLLANDSSAARGVSDPPPSYEVSISRSVSESSAASEASSYISSEDATSSSYVSSQDATALFVIPDGVQIFYISADGAVTAPSYPASLAVYVFNESRGTEAPPAFLQVGDWAYPLLPGRSPALRSDYGSYMFPDVSALEQGRTVGLILPDAVQVEERSLFHDLLHNFTALRTSEEKPPLEEAGAVASAIDRRSSVPPRPPPPAVLKTQPEVLARAMLRCSEPAVNNTQLSGWEPEPTSVTISNGLVTGAEWLSWGLKKGAEKTGQLMKHGSTKLRQQIQPNSQPTPIDPKYQKAAQIGSEMAGAAVVVSGFLITTLGKGTMALGRYVAPTVKKYGHQVLPESVTKPMNPGGRSKLDDVATVAQGGLQGFSTLYMGLEHAAKALASSISTETVSVVQHKYGTQAGQLTQSSLHAAGGAYLTAYNFSSLGVKAIAMRSAKDVGKAAVEHIDQEARPVKKKRRQSQEEEEEEEEEGEEEEEEERGASGGRKDKTGM